jgi:hypothetical protein
MRRDHIDLWGGLLLSVVGSAVALYAASRYEFGELRRVGPGFFPTMLGVLLAALGLMIAVPAWLRAGEMPKIAWREAVFVLLAVMVFGVLLERFGLVLAAITCVLLATVPAPRPGHLWRAWLAAAVAVIAWAIFVLGLGMTVSVFPWSP